LLLRDKNLRQRASRYWSDFELDIVSFDGREQLALEVSKLTQGELISFLEKMTRNLEKQYIVISSGGRFARL
jgi:secreted Zn-dependent insulinase-like peptidase